MNIMYDFSMRIIIMYFLLIGTLFADSHILEQENFEGVLYDSEYSIRDFQ